MLYKYIDINGAITLREEPLKWVTSAVNRPVPAAVYHFDRRLPQEDMIGPFSGYNIELTHLPQQSRLNFRIAGGHLVQTWASSSPTPWFERAHTLIEERVMMRFCWICITELKDGGVCSECWLQIHDEMHSIHSELLLTPRLSSQ